MPLSPVRKEIKLEIMFFGGAGCNEARRSCKTFDPARFVNTRFLAANTDHIQLQGHFPRDEGENLDYDRWRRLMNVVPMNHTGGQGAGHDEKIGRAAAEDEGFCQEITKSISACDVGLFVAALGGGTGTYAILKAARIAKEINAALPLKEKKTFIAIVMMSEESGKVKRAAKALDELSQLVFTIPIENSKLDPYVESLDGNQDIDTKEGYQKIHELELQPMISMLHSIIHDHWETTHSDQADLRTSTSKGRVGYFGFDPLPANTGTPVNGEEVGKRLFAGHFQNLDYAKNAVEVSLWKYGWSPILGSKKLNEVIKKNTNPSGNKDVEMNLGIKLEGVEPDKKWVAILCVAPDCNPPIQISRPVKKSGLDLDGILGEREAELTAAVFEGFSVEGPPPAQYASWKDKPRSGRSIPIEFVINGRTRGCSLPIELADEYPDLDNLSEEGRQEIFEAIKGVIQENPDSLVKWDRTIRITDRIRRFTVRG